MPKILHINSYYITNKLHGELVEKLDEKGWEQLVLIPIGKNSDKNVNEVKDLTNSTLLYVKAFNAISRFIWPLKIWSLYKYLKRSIDKGFTPEIIHAHSLIVNGLIAYLYYRKTKTPYLVTVRNTDINIFLSKSIIFRWIGERILNSASGVLFLSPAYRDIQLKRNIQISTFNTILTKTHIIPNGINDFWLRNKSDDIKTTDSGIVKIIFSGKLRENKNLKGLLEACEYLNEKGVKVSLDIVGDGPLKGYLANIQSNTKITLHGFVSDKNQLASIYRTCHIMAVPSFRESFGLIYAEGMSQGLPAIYSRGQGFDGFFEDGAIGYAVDPYDYRDIAAKMELIILNYSNLSRYALENVSFFSWQESVGKLDRIYTNALLKH